ncbi:putative NADP-dependent oxidoreductase YfmJ [Fusarium oxysporum f. sp. albedinis]|nr:putative NADP-dependent oxidoreductase YfmJ [Fusarium oxysporum f. sp. albedinis]
MFPLIWPIRHLPGHFADKCIFQPKCARCDGANHSTRSCPQAKEDAISASANEPIIADDVIMRNPFNPPVVVFLKDTKRVKRKCKCQDVFVHPIYGIRKYVTYAYLQATLSFTDARMALSCSGMR